MLLSCSNGHTVAKEESELVWNLPDRGSPDVPLDVRIAESGQPGGDQTDFETDSATTADADGNEATDTLQSADAQEDAGDLSAQDLLDGTLEDAVDTVQPADVPEDVASQVEDVAPEVQDTVEVLPCLPDCAGKQCGPDGCGADCGTCQPQETCSAGSCLCLPPCGQPEVVQMQYDILIAGAGTGGASAAIEAARLGMSVALLEETDWVGGQMLAAAVTSMDEGSANRESGIYKEFIDRIKTHYNSLGKSIGTCYWSTNTRCFEPSVGKAILEQMLAEEANIDLYLRTEVTAVDWQQQGSKQLVTGVHATRQTSGQPIYYQFGGARVIDATEYGDLLALGPAQYRAGNSVSGALDLSACVQDNTYTAVIKKYSGSVPGPLVMNSQPPGYTPEAVAHFQSIISPGGCNWVTGPNCHPADWLTHVGYRGMPDSGEAGTYDSLQPQLITRTGVNWANDHPFDVSDMAPDNRKQAHCAAKLRTLQFLYYAQHDLGQTNWSVANTEGYSTPYQNQQNLCEEIPAQFKELEKNMPVMPYVRESRRLIGVKTVTAGEIRREVHCSGCPPRAVTIFPTALAVGDYPVDLHACNTNQHLELALESEADVPSGFVGGAFQVPFEAFIPKTTDGFLVAEKNLSVTRLVNGAIRLQPITMLTGQASGAIAALSILKGVQPRYLSPVAVQNHLVSQGCKLSVQAFNDVPRSNPHWKGVQMAAAHDIMNGYDDLTFGISDDLQRGWGAILLVRLFNLPMGNPPNNPTFADVPASHPTYAWIEALVASGMTSGCSANPPLFCPDDPITRAAAAKFLVTGLGLNLDNAPAQPCFQDVTDPATWFFKPVQLACQNGILQPCANGLFCPEAPISRGEIADAVHKILLIQNP